MPVRAFDGRATHVLDTSALIALLLTELGHDVVSGAGSEGVVSTVSLSETIAKMVDKGAQFENVVATLNDLDYLCAAFDIPRAERAAALRAPTRRKSVSFADRACLALGIETGLPVLTTDRAWADLDLGLDIRLIR